MELKPGKLYKTIRSWDWDNDCDNSGKIFLFVERKKIYAPLGKDVVHTFLDLDGKLHNWSVSAEKETQTIKANWEEVRTD